MTTITFTGVVLGSTLEMHVVAPSINDQTVNVENSLFNGVVNREPMVLYGMPKDVYIEIRITHPNYMDHLDRMLCTNGSHEYVVWQEARSRQFNPTPAEQGGSTTVVPSQQDIARREREQHVADIVNSVPILRQAVEVGFDQPPEGEDNMMRFLVVHDPGCLITVRDTRTKEVIYDGLRRAVIGNHSWMMIHQHDPVDVKCEWPDGVVDEIYAANYYRTTHNAVSFVKNRVAAPTEAPPEFTGIRAIRL